MKQYEGTACSLEHDAMEVTHVLGGQGQAQTDLTGATSHGLLPKHLSCVA